MLLADGFEEAFLGIVTRCGLSKPIAAYDREMCIEILMSDGATREEAEEWFCFNVVGSWVGDQTPMFIERVSLDEAIKQLMENEYDE